MNSAKIVNENHDPDKLVFVDVFISPAYIYKAHHNVFPIDDTAHAAHFMNYFQTDVAQFYHHENNYPIYMLELEKKNEMIHVVSRTDFKVD
jgi:hypothetical protein